MHHIKQTLKLAAAVTVFAMLSAYAMQATAQTVGVAQEQSSRVEGHSQAIISPGAVNIVSNGAPELAHRVVESTGMTTVKTTGNAIAPGVYNSSGMYTCFGGASAALGVLGTAVGGGVTVSQDDCYRLHRMDKAAARANASGRVAADPAADVATRAAAQRVVDNFSRLWDAEYCAMAGGADAYAKAGMTCPNAPAEAERANAALNGQNVQQPTDPYVRRRLGL